VHPASHIGTKAEVRGNWSVPSWKGGYDGILPFFLSFFLSSAANELFVGTDAKSSNASIIIVPQHSTTRGASADIMKPPSAYDEAIVVDEGNTRLARGKRLGQDKSLSNQDSWWMRRATWKRQRAAWQCPYPPTPYQPADDEPILVFWHPQQQKCTWALLQGGWLIASSSTSAS
jgi:hypothetical protein